MLIANMQSHHEDFERLMKCFNFLEDETQNIIKQHVYETIKTSFTAEELNSKFTVIQIYDNVTLIVKNKLENQIKYQTAINDGLNEYLNTQNDMFQNLDSDDAKMTEQNMDKLREMYDNIDGSMPKIAECMKIHIISVCNQLIQKSKEFGFKDQQLIHNLINLQKQYLRIVKNQFRSQTIFDKALIAAFEEFINKEYYVSALLASFANKILKKAAHIQDLESTMDHIVLLYGYIRDKDLFERDYQMHLADRLLLDLVIKDENRERSMINKLKQEAGYHWTSKVEDMLKDIQRSKELMRDFNQNNELTYEFNVAVCTSGAWPSGKIHFVKKPPEIAYASQQYAQFYCNKFSGRRLNFQMMKGRANIAVKFNSNVEKVLNVSTYQMLVLLLFNSKDVWTFKEMLEVTQIPHEDLQLAVCSMIHQNINVLSTAKPEGKKCTMEDSFQINSAYTNSETSYQKISTFGHRELFGQPPPFSDEHMEAVYRLRRHQLDAAIVRIMKARRYMKHDDLVSEVVKQLRGRFTPKSIDIQKRVDVLIHLKYMDRDKNNEYDYTP
eukprot:501872_1